MTDVDHLTRAYREARQRYLSARAEARQCAGRPSRYSGRITKELITKLRVAMRIAATELADAIAGPA